MVTYTDFKKAIEIVSGQEIIAICKMGKNKECNEEIISLNGIWFSIGDLNDHSQWSIVKINHEVKDGRFEMNKNIGDLCDCIEYMAYCKNWFNGKEED